ncbi:hypothetical protein Tco_0262031 [Tanacetum coccineum]
MIYLVVLADAAESVRDAIGFEYFLSSSRGWTKSPVLWAEIGESSLTGLELVQETTDKVVLVKEKPKAVRDCQKSYVDYRVRFGKNGKLAPRYVGPFKILERIGHVAYRLRLPKELNSVHDTFHVSNLKKCLADANLHVPLDEIKVDKTLHFVKEPIEIMGQEIKKLKLIMTKLIKGEFEKLKSVKINDVLLTCNTSLEIFNEEFNRMSRMEDDLFTYEVEIVEAFKEFNYLLQIDPDVLTKDIDEFKSYEEYKDDWIYEWNKVVPWVHERPWTENGVWKEPTPVKHHWLLQVSTAGSSTAKRRLSTAKLSNGYSQKDKTEHGMKRA